MESNKKYMAARKIAVAINALRPEWGINQLTKWIQNHASHIPPHILAAAMAWAAMDHQYKFPNVITHDPVEWLLARHALAERLTKTAQPIASATNSVEPLVYARHGSSGRMPCHPHGHPDHQTCPDCAQERAQARARRERGPQPGQNWRALASQHGWDPGMKHKPHKHIQEPPKPPQEPTNPTQPTPT